MCLALLAGPSAASALASKEVAQSLPIFASKDTSSEVMVWARRAFYELAGKPAFVRECTGVSGSEALSCCLTEATSVQRAAHRNLRACQMADPSISAEDTRVWHCISQDCCVQCGAPTSQSNRESFFQCILHRLPLTV